MSRPTAGSRATPTAPDAPESPYAWIRLLAALALSAIGGVGMWSVIVTLPVVQAEFGVARSAASLPYAVTMICFGFGGILMGRLSDRLGILVPVTGGGLALGLGYAVASQATSLWQFVLAQGLLVGVAGSATFAPIIADTSLWFTRRRGIAVAIIASGSYIAGTVWPPVVQFFIERGGWRGTYQGIAMFCVTTMVPLALVLNRPATSRAAAGTPPGRAPPRPWPRSSYYGEIFGAGIESVGGGQTEAARSTGLTRLQALTYVVIPQATRNVLPDLISNTLEVVKLTSPASVVALPEFLYAARSAQSVTYNPSPIIAAASVSSSCCGLSSAC